MTKQTQTKASQNANNDREVMATWNATKVKVFNAVKELGEATFASVMESLDDEKVSATLV